MTGNVDSTLAWLAPNAIWLTVVIYLVMHPHVAEKWGAILSRLYSRISRRAEMRSVALDIQGRIGSFSRSINSEVPGILPPGVKIQWTTGEVTRESFIKDGAVILRMNYHTNQDANVVHAAMEWVARGMLHDSRPHVDTRVMESADLICTKKLIEKERRTALPLYFGDILNPAIESGAELDKYVRIMHQLDEAGYFTRVLLRELQHLGVAMQFCIPEQCVKDETKRFVEFLDEKINKKERGVDVDPTFIGAKIRMSIVYVAKRTEPPTVAPHLDFIEQCVAGGIDTIYVCARGRYNAQLVKQLEKRLALHPKLVRVFHDEDRLRLLRGRKSDNICVRYDVVGADTETRSLH